MNFLFTTAFMGSFIAAASAQIISHKLTIKRDDKKYAKECLQGLYAPTISKVIDYLKKEADAYRANDTKSQNAELIFKQIMINIGSNLKYAEADLINIYEEIRSSEGSDRSSRDLGRESAVNDYIINLRIALANQFLSQYIKVNNTLKSNSNFIKENIVEPYFFTHLYLLVNESGFAMDFKKTEIFELYALVHVILYTEKNILEKIIYIRKERNYVDYYQGYQSDKYRAMDAYTSAYQFLYNIFEKFSSIDPRRAAHWKECLDEHILIN